MANEELEELLVSGGQAKEKPSMEDKMPKEKVETLKFED